MKTAVMKLSALVVLCGAGLLLGDTIRIPAARVAMETLRTEVHRAIDGRVGIEWFTVVLCLLVMAIALWSLLPRIVLPRRTVRIAGEHGPLWVDLRPVGRALTRIARRLPAVHRATLRVRPADHGQVAVVAADVVLRVPSRDCAAEVGDRVGAQLRRAAEELLGAGAQVRMQTRVVGLRVNADTVAARLEREVPTAPAAAEPPAREVDPRLEALDDVALGPENDPAARAALRQSMALLEALDTAPAGSGDGLPPSGEGPADEPPEQDATRGDRLN